MPSDDTVWAMAYCINDISSLLLNDMYDTDFSDNEHSSEENEVCVVSLTPIRFPVSYMLLSDWIVASESSQTLLNVFSL